MRIARLLGAATLAVAALWAGQATAAPARHAATVQVVVRPVTSSGHAVSGYGVHRENDGQIDCSERSPSPGAVNRNIQLCFPSAEYAIACWRSTAKHRSLCTRDPSKKSLVSIPRTGKFAATSPPRKSRRAPLLIVLEDGTRCSIRDGGAWGSLSSHPTWVGTYSCTRHGIVWSPPNADHYGVNESHASWTVRTSTGSGNGRVVTRHIKRAYFVGTARR